MRTTSVRSERRRLLVAALALVAAGAAQAEDVRSTFVDAKGNAVDEAVVALMPVSGKPQLQPKPTIIDQIDKEYVPRITPVVVGTSIRFPNKDDIRHHVYSMSDAKKFELPLYEGTPADPVTFDEPGVVVLGCNIHDWMRGYIYILETPHYAVSGEDGSAALQVPPGEYDVEVWHPRQQGDEPLTRRVTVASGEATELAFTLELKRSFGVRRTRGGGRGRKYR